MSEVPAYTLIDNGSERLWADFQQMVRDLGWFSPDNTVLWATPQLSSTNCVFARRSDDGSMLGCCVWNEHENLAWIGFYMTLPSVRGCGLGGEIWTRTMARIREKKLVIGLRAVQSMRDKYANGATPVEISRIRKHLLTVDQMKEFCDRHASPHRCSTLYSELNEDQREDVLRFDLEVTRKDRSEWLQKLVASETSQVAVLLNEDDGKVRAYSAVSSIGHPEQNMFKIGPCYASSVAEFALLAKSLMLWVKKFPEGARIIVGILSGSVGERDLADALGHRLEEEIVTLCSEDFDPNMDLDRCFVPNNAHCHFDA